MKLYPDNWTLYISGVNTATEQAADNSEPYDSEAAARLAWDAISQSNLWYFDITTAVIYPPEGSGQQPIVLKGQLPTQS